MEGSGDYLLPRGDVAFFLDRDYIMAALGAIAGEYRAGAWQLLRESFGIEN